MNAHATTLDPRGRLEGIRSLLSVFWQERNRRERMLLACAGVAIAFGLLYALFLDPALSGRAELRKNLPPLRQQAAQMQALSKEAAALSSAGAPPAPAATKQSLEEALARKGLKAQSVSLTGGLARLQLSSAPFSSLLEWLDQAQRDAGLTVVEANFVALPERDMVNATLTLRQQANDE